MHKAIFAVGITALLALAMMAAGPSNVPITRYQGTFVGTFSGDGSAITGIVATTTNAVARLNGAGTNTTLRATGPARYLMLTNYSAISGLAADTNVFLAYFTPDNRSTKLLFAGTNGRNGALYWWPTHGGDNLPELILESDGSIAFGSKWFQIGIDGYTPSFAYLQKQRLNTVNTNLGESIPLLFAADYWTAPGTRMQAGSQTSGGYMPGFHLRASDTNGNADLGVYSKFAATFDGNVPSGTDAGNVEQHAFTLGPNPGFTFSGGLTNDGVAGTSVHYWLDDTHVLQVRNGIVTGISAPDSDAASYITRASVSSAAAKGAINMFITDLKAAFLFTNVYAYYPLYGTNGTMTGQNCIANSYNVTWNGALSDATNHTLLGVTNSGASGAWGDTGFNPSTASVNATNFCMMVWVASNPTTGSGGYGGTAGAAVGAWANTPANSYSLVLLDTSNIDVHGAFDSGANAVARYAHGGTALGFVISSSAANDVTGPISFWNSTRMTSAGGGKGVNVPNVNFGLFCMNGGGFQDHYLRLKLSGAAFTKAMTTTQIASFKTIVQRLQTSLGR